jgi:hypothetical protein
MNLGPIIKRNDHLHGEVTALGSSRTEVASGIGDLRSEIEGLRSDLISGIRGLRSEIVALRSDVVDRLDAVDTNMEKIQARVDTALRLEGWAITPMVPVVFSLIGGGFWIAWHAAKLDSRVERMESRLGKEPPATTPGSVPRSGASARGR